MCHSCAFRFCLNRVRDILTVKSTESLDFSDVPDSINEVAFNSKDDFYTLFLVDGARVGLKIISQLSIWSLLFKLCNLEPKYRF